MPKKSKTQKQEKKPRLGRPLGSGKGREVRLVLMISPDEDRAYRAECERNGWTLQQPAREVLAARFPLIFKR